MIAQGRIGFEFSGARESGSTIQMPAMLRGVLVFALRNPRDVAGALVAIGAFSAIVVNCLFMQAGHHPAPIFAIRPLPVATADATGTIPQLPRPRPVITEMQKTEAVPLPRPRAQSASVQAVATTGGRNDPIADLLNPSPARQMNTIQRALNEFGYGPVKVTGTYDDNTRVAIEQFERDHGLPVSGQASARFRREFTTATGRALD
jgi:hypothetical protein